MEKMIEIKTPFGWSFCCNYIEEIAERLNRAGMYDRQIYVSDYENQLETHDCDFIIFGDKYHYTLK